MRVAELCAWCDQVLPEHVTGCRLGQSSAELETVLVCTACGSPWCYTGREVCVDALRATTAACICEWYRDRSGPVGMTPMFINPACYVHGEVP